MFSGYAAGKIIMALAAKFFVFISFDAVYVYSAELFPTAIRLESYLRLLSGTFNFHS